MDIISFNEAATANGRIEKFIENPDSTSGIVTVPKTIASGETITIPDGRVAVLPNVQVDGTLNVEGEVFIPSGGSVSTTAVDATVVKQNGNVVANDSTVVHKTGNETKAGVLTLSDGLILQGQNVSPFSGFKNYIINCNFDIWQRGTSGVSLGQLYTADMWKVLASGANTNWSRASSADFDSYSKFVGWGLKWYGDPASNNSPIEHRIESLNAYKLSGKKVTLSFLAKCSANSNLGVEIGLANAIDNFSTVANISNQTVNLTTTTQKFSVTFDLTDKDVRNGINLVFRPSSPANIHWIAQVQLEEGSVATQFENRPYGLELSLCQRYYEVGRCIQQLGIGTTIGVALTGQVFFKTSKRIVPTVTYLDYSGAQNKVTLLNNSGTETNGVSVIAGNQTNYDMRLTASTTNTTQNGILFTYTASAEL